MTKTIKKHLYYYISLFAILFLGFFLSFQVKDDRVLQNIIIIITGASYVFWGLIHHFRNHDLSAKIVIEYSLVGCLGLAIIIFLIKGA